LTKLVKKLSSSYILRLQNLLSILHASYVPSTNLLIVIGKIEYVILNMWTWFQIIVRIHFLSSSFHVFSVLLFPDFKVKRFASLWPRHLHSIPSTYFIIFNIISLEKKIKHFRNINYNDGEESWDYNTFHFKTSEISYFFLILIF